jgi:hypothetical protein
MENILSQKALVLGTAGVGKTTLLLNEIRNSNQKCIYISIHEEEIENFQIIKINKPDEELKAVEVSKIGGFIENGKSFAIQVQLGYVGQVIGMAYLNDVLLEILDKNKDFTVVLDDARYIAGSDFSDTYKKLLEQNTFPVISVCPYMENVEYIFDFVEKVYLFKVSPTDFDILKARNFVSDSDTGIFDQKVGEYIIK